MAAAPILAEMSASDLAVIVVTAAALVSVAAVLVVAVRMLGVLRSLRASLERIDAEVTPLIDELHGALAESNDQLDRMDRLVGSAESISATVDATSKLAYRALSAPVIKTVAVTTGARKAGRRIRRGT